MAEKAVKVLYLDLDGTVRQGTDDALGRFVNGPDDVVVWPEAVALMRAWKADGGRIVGVTNQGGVALGLLSYSDMASAIRETQRQAENLFDVIHVCTHHPDATDPEMARCWCRKPSGGAIAEAAHELKNRCPGDYFPPYMGLMVGDRPEDEECARQAGLPFMWASDWRSGAERPTGLEARWLTTDGQAGSPARTCG